MHYTTKGSLIKRRATPGAGLILWVLIRTHFWFRVAKPPLETIIMSKEPI